MSFQTALEKFWYSNSKGLLWLRPLHWPFLFLVTIKRYLYKKGLLKSAVFSRPLLVVGNITLGGTGKTPFILKLVKLLQTHGIKVGIVSRGYSSQIKKVPHQVTPRDSAELVGDEAFMLFDNLTTPLVIDPDRSRATKFLIENNAIDIVISDDGLQHYAMSRDLEIVIIDGGRQLGNQMILPLGPLREGKTRLEQVDFVIQNGELPMKFADWHFKIDALSFIQINSGEEYPLNYFKSQSVQAVAAIGNPQRFYSLLNNYCMIESTLTMTDHHAFQLSDLNQLNPSPVVMTEKDAVKCLPFAKSNWYYLKIEPRLQHTLEQALIAQIKQLIKINQSL